MISTRQDCRRKLYTMLSDDERRLHLHQCRGTASERPHRRPVVAGPQPPSSSSFAASRSRSRAAVKITRKYRQAAVRRREYRKLKAIVPAVSAKHAVSKVGHTPATDCSYVCLLAPPLAEGGEGIKRYRDLSVCLSRSVAA